MEGEEPEMMQEEDPMMMGEENSMGDKSLGSSTSFASDKTRFYLKKDQFGETVGEPPSYDCCFVASLYILAITAGLLQGYQVGIIAGLELFVADEYKDLKQDIGSHERELFVAIFSLGAAFGSLFSGEISDKIGRKWIILLGDALVGAGFLIIVFGKKIGVGFVGRCISGVGSGFLSFVIPVYLGEVGPQKWTKLSQSIFGFSSGIGMIGGLDLAIPFRHHWKLLFKLGLIPVVAQVLFTCFMPESHMYYINNGNDEEALKVLKNSMDEGDAEKELSILKYERQFFFGDGVTFAKKWGDLFSTYAKPFFISIGMSTFAQLIGISAFLYYGSDIFEQAGNDLEGIQEREEASDILDNFVVGTYVFGNIISAIIIPLTGRKWILTVGLPTIFVSLLGLSYTMHEANYGDQNDSDKLDQEEYKHTDRAAFLFFLMLYVLAASIGFSGAVSGITSEIIPNYLLGTAVSLSSFTGWITNFIINLFFLDFLDDPQGKWYVFLILAFNVVLAYLFVTLCVPETINKTIKENLIQIIGPEYKKQQVKMRKEYNIKFVNVKNERIQAEIDSRKDTYLALNSI